MARRPKKDRAIIAFFGEAGWYEKGITPFGTFSRSGGLREDELTAKIRVDLRPKIRASDNPAGDILREPNLDLSLPAGHVRDLFEGCIGSPGTTDGHQWDGSAPDAWAGVGLGVYLELLARTPAVVVAGQRLAEKYRAIARKGIEQ